MTDLPARPPKSLDHNQCSLVEIEHMCYNPSGARPPNVSCWQPLGRQPSAASDRLVACSKGICRFRAGFYVCPQATNNPAAGNAPLSRQAPWSRSTLQLLARPDATATISFIRRPRAIKQLPVHSSTSERDLRFFYCTGRSITGIASAQARESRSYCRRPPCSIGPFRQSTIGPNGRRFALY